MLALELIEKITDYLDDDDVRNLALVSKKFYLFINSSQFWLRRMMLLKSSSHPARTIASNCAGMPAFYDSLSANSMDLDLEFIIDIVNEHVHMQLTKEVFFLIDIFRQRKEVSRIIDAAIISAAGGNRLDILDQIVANYPPGGDMIDSILNLFCVSSYVDGLRWVVKKYPWVSFDQAILTLLNVYPNHANTNYESYYNCFVILLGSGADIHVDNDRCLRTIAGLGDLALLKLFVNSGADIHANEDEALISAYLSNNVNCVSFLLVNGANVHAKGDFCIRSASRYGRTSVVSELISHGADIHAFHDEALLSSVENYHVDTMKFLIESGADIHAGGEEILKRALRELDPDMVEYLLSKGCQLSLVPYSLITKAILDSSKCFKMLVAHGIELDDLASDALKSAELENIIKLLDLKPTWKCDFVHVPTELLQSKSYIDRVLKLKEIDPNSFLKKVLLKLVSEELSDEMMEYLAENLDPMAFWEDEALQIACKSYQIKNIQFLVRMGADVNFKEGLPLRSVSYFQCPKLITELIQLGADVNAECDEAFRISMRLGLLENAKILLENGANIHAENEEALVQASERGDEESVIFLLNNGADAYYGKYAAKRAAMKHGHVDIANILNRATNSKPIRLKR